jgi:hypothetical protein
MMMTNASRLDNATLTAELSRLARCERAATAALIVHLSEFDARRLHEGEGYPSLFQYCMAVLHLSEDAVYNRIHVARVARRYPAIIEGLETGALSLTTVKLLVPHLTAENQAGLLAAASGKGKQAVEELLACRFPQADVAARVRKLPSPGVLQARDASASPVCAWQPAASLGSQAPATATAAAPGEGATPITVPTPARPVVRPLAPERYEIRFTASGALREKLRTAQDLLGHAIPSGDIAEIFDRALTVLVADLSRRKLGASSRPRKGRGQSESSRNIPAQTKRLAVARGGARCAFVARNGRRCGERRFLEFHHVVPHAVGGKPTLGNIELRCRAHNGHEVDRYFGPGVRRVRGGTMSDDRPARLGGENWFQNEFAPANAAPRAGRDRAEPAVVDGARAPH